MMYMLYDDDDGHYEDLMEDSTIPEEQYCLGCYEVFEELDSNGWCSACARRENCRTCNGRGEVDSDVYCSRCRGYCRSKPCPDCRGEVDVR